MTTSDKTWDSLKAGYLRQVEKSLAAAGYPSSKGIVEEVDAHLDQRFADLPPEKRNWDGYQAAITEMGPPSDYAELLGLATLRRRIITWRRVAIGVPLILLLVFLLFAIGVLRGIIPLGFYQGPRIYPLPGERFEWTFETDPQLVGQWEGVDFVDSPAQFKPESKSWRGELWLRNLDFRDGGDVFIAVGSDGAVESKLHAWTGWAWTKDWILDRACTTRAQYRIEQVDDGTYLFFPWLSGDVSLRNLEPSYYVLKKTKPGSPEP
jgi:hypothetical protein